ncbi:MAG: Gfo/Idh/MocA family oxidoreductase [Fibrella sp.]|nr:Gfo/Idh/MocA family oxidoreductase [Armatimonadota bacterium]
MSNTDTVSDDDYSLGDKSREAIVPAPELPYRPRDPKSYRPQIGLIGCGGITASHLRAYRNAGYAVAVLCDLAIEKAEKRRDEFFPDAAVTTDYRVVLSREDITVVDIATHPPERLPLIAAAIHAGKHVLSQKPFVMDLDEGERLVALAEANGVKLAVNQNGRWAPHFSYMREAVRSGQIGDLLSVHAGVHWDHSWTKGTPFEKIYDLVFYDFAIHWFDFLSTLFSAQNRMVRRVQASRSLAQGQEIMPPLLAQVIVEFDGGQASAVFDAAMKFGKQDRTYIGGTAGSIISTGPSLDNQTLTLYTEAGAAVPALTGAWFPDGFHGTMAELLCAIEEDREPMNNARENLRSLALCFAAIAAANDGAAKVPGEVRRLPEGSAPQTTTGGRP